MLKPAVIIELGNHTTVRRMAEKTDDGLLVTIFGMEYSLDDLVAEGWHYEVRWVEQRPNQPSLFAWKD